tara:strand:- start:622 stop:2067 length:1446 start_codon:yes stop_codon:yes gene_type:complete
MIKTASKLLFILISITLIFSNSRVAFSRPGSVLRTPGSSHFDDNIRHPLFTVGFASEVVNFNLPSGSTSLYLQTKTKSGLHLGLSYTTLSDPRDQKSIEADEENTFSVPTEIGLHIQQRVYSAGNINIDIGINDIMSRDYNGNSEFQSPSIFAVFSSKKDFDKYSMIFNYGFGSGKVGYDPQLQEADFEDKDESTIKPYLGISLFTPEIARLKNKVNFLFEYDGSGINLGTKIPITDEYSFSFAIIHANYFGDFGRRSKVGWDTVPVFEDATTISMGFEMNIPRLNKKNIMINPYASKAATNALLEASSDQQVLYTSEAVEQLADSLNTIIQSTRAAYDAIADSIRFLTFSLENSEIENTSLMQKIAVLDDSLLQHQNQKIVDITNYNKASLHVSRSLRYLYERDYNKALTAIDKAIELNPNLAIAYARKGSIYIHLGQVKNASINYNIALKLDPEFDEVREILQALKTDQLKSADLEEKE